MQPYHAIQLRRTAVEHTSPPLSVNKLILPHSNVSSHNVLGSITMHAVLIQTWFVVSSEQAIGIDILSGILRISLRVERGDLLLTRHIVL